jgi:hypothetical protein
VYVYFYTFSAGIGARYSEDTKATIAKTICMMFAFMTTVFVRTWSEWYVDFSFLSLLFAQLLTPAIPQNLKDIFDGWEYKVWIEKMRLLHNDLVYLSIRESTTFQRSKSPAISDKKSPNSRKRAHEDSSCLSTESMDRRMTRGSQFSLSELFQLRCRSCNLCIMADCSKCESCIVNQNSSSRDRQVCWLKLCQKVSKESKIRLPAVDGWSFFFCHSSGKSPSSISHLPNVYRKLRLLHSSSKSNMTMNIFDAIHACESDEKRKKLGRFFEQTFGSRLHEPTNHPLIGKGYYHTSFSVNGIIRDFLGKISHCFKHMISGELLFKIQYTELPKSSLKSISNEVSVEFVSESMAWGGYKSYSMRTRESALIREGTMLKAPFYVQWTVPSSRIVKSFARNYYPSLILEYKGSKLQFDVKPSMIPSAGNGFFVSSIGEKDFVLEPGEMLDLGVYAPLHDFDVKSKHIALVKNLLFDWQIETWAFAARKNQPDAFVYDPTEDCSGHPNCSTQMNGICFVNEIDGKSETACVTAQYDPEGNIHYLFGHWEEYEGPLIVPSDGNAHELLVRILILLHFNAVFSQIN